MEEKNETGKCLSCGKELHDKRPYCMECRRKKELERRIAEKETEKAAPKKMSAAAIFTAAVAFMALAVFGISFFIASSAPKTEEDGTGSIIIESEPSGADVVSLDDSFPNGKTPLKAENLKAGKIYKFTVSLSGCGNANEISGVMAEKDKTVTYKEILEKQGSISVNSMPPGASVYIDGVKTEYVTPAEIANVPEGSKKIKFVFSQDNIYECECPVRWKETSHLYIIEDREKSGIQFSIPDGITVSADGKELGKTPLPPIMLDEGAHEIALSSDDFAPMFDIVMTEKGKVLTYSPDIKNYGTLEINADRRAYLLSGGEQLALPAKVRCKPGEKFIAEVIGDDGTSWKQGFMLKEGERRKVTAALPEPPAPIAYEPPSSASYSSPAPITDFSGFNCDAYFPPSQWIKTEDFNEDVDMDGESEKIIGLKSLGERGPGGQSKIYAFLIKKHDGQFYDRIPLRNPRLGCLGEGELISLEVIKADQFGYREIAYSVGTAKDGITQKGAFAIYKGQCYSPSWASR